MRALKWRRPIAMVVAAFVLTTSCATVEEYLPTIVIAGGAAASVLALNYYDDPTYALAAIGVIGSLIPVAYGAADSFIEHRRKQRELEELEAIEQGIQAEYASTQANPAGGTWGTVAPVPGQDPGSSWGVAGEQPAPPPRPLPTPEPGAGASPWGDRYPQPGAPPQSAQPHRARRIEPENLSLDVALLRRTETGMQAMNASSVLRGSRGDAPSEELRAFFRPSHDAYVYVVSIDSVGRVQPLFPRTFPDTVNPVRGGQGVLLPGGDLWYGLDRYAGLEQVYFQASPEPLDDLVAKLAPLTGKPPPGLRGDVHVVSEPSIIETPQVKTRGLTGARPIVKADLGVSAGQHVPATRFEALGPGGSVAATLVFQHE